MLHFRRIRYFVAAYEEGSIKRAAQRENVVQPAVSVQIRQLEAELALQLFDRSAQGIQPTPAGHHFYRLCSDLLRRLRKTEQEMLDYGGTIAGTIAVGVMPSICRGILPGIVGSFAAAHPAVALRIVEGYSGTLAEQLAAGDLDVAICNRPAPQMRLKLRLIVREPLVLVSGPDGAREPGQPCQLADIDGLNLIVDAHHHVWRRADQPWLQGPTVPRIFGPYDPIKRDYPVAEFLDDLAGTGVVKSVYVQTNWAPARAVEEVEWVQETADRHGWPHAIVGFADLAGPDATRTLRAQSRAPLMRGIRQQLHWHENPLYRFAPRPDAMNDADFRRNLARVRDRGWLFELQVFAGQMADGAALARDFPDLVLVLEHAGMLEDRSPEGRRAWRDGMRRLADQPNVSTKFSGLGTFLRRNDPGHVAEVVAETLDIFGPERCLWGSNFPIEKLWTDYASILAAVRAALADRPEAERRAVLHDNAVRLYRL